MSSPAKKRKLNNGIKNEKTQSKGLEYFFSKQKKNGDGSSSRPETSAAEVDNAPLTDEELARKLQAEWDLEAAEMDSQPVTDTTPSTKSDPDQIGEPVPVEKLRVEVSEQPALSTIFGGTKTLALQSAGMDEDNITTSIPLDEPPLTFVPSEYIGPLKEHWSKDGGNASYALLTRCFVLVSGTASRIKIVDTLVNCLRLLIEGDPESLLPAVCTAGSALYHTG